MSEELMSASGDLKNVELASLGIDTTYQRAVLPHHKKLVKNFDPRVCGPLIVGDRGTGEGMWVIDGQQRREALMKLGFTHWRALVLESSGAKFEAGLFQTLGGGRGTVKPLTNNDVFRAQLAADDPVALSVEETARKWGLRMCVHNGTAKPGAGVIGGVKWFYQHVRANGADAFDRALETATRAWPGDPLLSKTPLLMGLTVFWATFRQSDKERFIRLLQKRPALTFIQLLQSLKISAGGNSRHFAIVREFVSIYNKKLSPNNRLKLAGEVA